MNIGDVVNMAGCEVMDGSSTYGYKANKGEFFVFLFLGKEPRVGSCPLDANRALKGLGWINQEEADALREAAEKVANFYIVDWRTADFTDGYKHPVAELCAALRRAGGGGA